MSRGATLSIMGLYNADNSIFDMMEFPEGFTQEQKETVKYNILVECAELEILYPNPVVMKTIIGIWSRKEVSYWDRIYKASLAKYDPIENYRRNETETVEDDRIEEHSGADQSHASGSDRNTGNSTSTDSESGRDTTTNKITGYDSGTAVVHDSSEIDYGHKNTNSTSGTNIQDYGRTDTIIHGEKISHGGTTKRSVLAFGNIGTMTSQDMLTQEYNVAKIIQVVPIIVDSFKDRFCLQVY